jgi:SpoVK/Ycf46/Vps4 family AAA+-type ATPase
MPVDLSASYYDQYRHAMRRAEKALASGDQRAGASEYQRAAIYLDKYAGYIAGSQQKQTLQARVAELKALAVRLNTQESRPPLEKAAVASGGGDAEGLTGRITALIRKADVAWADIAGLADTKREIKTAYALVMARKPQGVQVNAPRTLLLYGPPGTGKTLLAAATSNGLDATFFSVKVSDLLSKYFGESTQLVSALYEEARARAPSVVFMDEFDAISRARGGGGGESGAERRLLSTLLAELDGLSGKRDPAFILTIAATNRPWDLDSAIRSRFAREVYVSLPDQVARRRILEIHLTEKGHRSEVALPDLVARTEGYAGRELSQICEHAVAHMISRVNPDLDGLVDRGREALAEYELRVAPLTEADFEAALEAVGDPETSAEDLARFRRWHDSAD